MKPEAALATLLEQSSRVEAAVIFDREGKVAAGTIDDGDRAKRLADAGLALLEEAERRRPAKTSEPLAQLEVALPGGSAFVVQEGDRLIAATTGAEPTVGLVFYDLKKCLRDIEAAKPKAKRAPAKKRAGSTTRKKKKDDARS